MAQLRRSRKAVSTGISLILAAGCFVLLCLGRRTHFHHLAEGEGRGVSNQRASRQPRRRPRVVLGS